MPRHTKKNTTGNVYHNPHQYQSMPLGIVVRRMPGVTRWARYAWKAVAVLPGAAQANWRELRREDDAVEYHAATPTIELHGAETEAYLHGLAAEVPSVYVVLRATGDEAHPLDVVLVTASPYEAQDYDDSGEEQVEKVPMPAALQSWVEEFVSDHHKEEAFKKRRRDKTDLSKSEDGVGDARIPQMADVYRAPAQARKERLH